MYELGFGSVIFFSWLIANFGGYGWRLESRTRAVARLERKSQR